MVVPVFDEEPVLPELIRRLLGALDALSSGLRLAGEVVAVDDGSRDESLRVLRDAAQADARLRVVELGTNLGQHEAVLAGFRAARAPYLVTIDADLQNPPEEIPRVAAALLEGHDLVATRRVRREDSLHRRLVSRLANATSRRLARLYTEVPLHDIGCMLRGYRRELVREMLAAADEDGAPAPFIPALSLRFARNVRQIDVAHAPRAHGRSRYGWLGLLGLQARLIATLARRRPPR